MGLWPGPRVGFELGLGLALWPGLGLGFEPRLGKALWLGLGLRFELGLGLALWCGLGLRYQPGLGLALWPGLGLRFGWLVGCQLGSVGGRSQVSWEPGMLFWTPFQGFTLEPAQNLGLGLNQGQKWIQHPQNRGRGCRQPQSCRLDVGWLSSEEANRPQATPNRTPNDPNRRPTKNVLMVSLCFDGAESIPGLGLPTPLGFGPSSGAKTSGPDQNLGQNLNHNRPSTGPRLILNQPRQPTDYFHEVGSSWLINLGVWGAITHNT